MKPMNVVEKGMAVMTLMYDMGYWIVQIAFAWAEALIKQESGAVSDEMYEAMLEQFTEEELIDITLAVITMNSFNRANPAFPNTAVAGACTPGMRAV